jgi:uncharacterized membrane protein HdeD (DUF308 family)
MSPRHVDPSAEVDARIQQIQRRWRIIAGAAAVAAGAVGLLWPHNALRLVALLFGVYLIVVGISRVTGSVSAAAPSGSRAAQIALGALVVVTGILCLNNPFGSVTALTWLVGVGWVIDGVASVLSVFFRFDPSNGGTSPRRQRATGLVILSGTVSTIAGIVLIAVPYEAVRSLLFFGSFSLVAIGVITLLVAFIRPTRDS